MQLAAQVLYSIVVQHRGLVRAALQNMPPLPSLAVLKEVNAVLIQVRSLPNPALIIVPDLPLAPQACSWVCLVKVCYTNPPC